MIGRLRDLRWSWYDWSLSVITARRPHGGLDLRSLFAFKCGLCRRFSAGCDVHWFCGCCQRCKQDLDRIDDA